MKKLLALAIAALSVCAAQAVTITWEFTGITFYNDGGQNISYALLEGSVSAMNATNLSTYIYAGTTTSSEGVTTSFGTVKEGYTDVLTLLSSSKTNGVSGSAGTYSNSVSDVTVTAGTTYTLVFGDTYWYNNQSDSAEAASPTTSYLKVVTFTVPEDADVAQLSTITLSGSDLDMKNTTDATIAVELKADGTGNLTGVLPEPTSLALLALGWLASLSSVAPKDFIPS